MAELTSDVLFQGSSSELPPLCRVTLVLKANRETEIQMAEGFVLQEHLHDLQHMVDDAQRWLETVRTQQAVGPVVQQVVQQFIVNSGLIGPNGLPLRVGRRPRSTEGE